MRKVTEEGKGRGEEPRNKLGKGRKGTGKGREMKERCRMRHRKVGRVERDVR